MRALLCVHDAAPERLIDSARQLLTADVVWIPAHVVDARGRRDLDLLRSGVIGSGPLSHSQRSTVDTASQEHTRAVLQSAEHALASRGLQAEPGASSAGEPGRELCALARQRRADVIVLSASRSEIGRAHV